MQTSIGVPQPTFEIDTDDTVQTIDSTKYEWDTDNVGVKNNKVKAKSALIQCLTNDVRFAFGVDPSTTSGYLLSVGDNLELKSHAAIKNLRFINAAALADGKLVVTVER